MRSSDGGAAKDGSMIEHAASLVLETIDGGRSWHTLDH